MATFLISSILLRTFRWTTRKWRN